MTTLEQGDVTPIKVYTVRPERQQELAELLFPVSLQQHGLLS